MIRFLLALVLVASAAATGTQAPKWKDCGTCCFGATWIDEGVCASQHSQTCWTAEQICDFESGPHRMDQPLHKCGDHCCDGLGVPQFEIWKKCKWYKDEGGWKVPGTWQTLYDTEWCGKPCCEDWGECCHANYNWDHQAGTYADQCKDSKEDPQNWPGECISPRATCEKWGYHLCPWSPEYCCSGSGYWTVANKCDYLKWKDGIKDGDWCPTGCGDEPPATFGDPHFKTWHGHSDFEYHGECDIVLLKAPLLDMDIHVRTTIRYDYSFVSQAAVRIGQETFELDSWGEYMLDGMMSVDLPNFINGYPITAKHQTLGSTKRFNYNIHLEDGVMINLASFKDYVSVKIFNGTAAMFYGSSGIMGDFETGDMFARDGKTVLLDPERYGPEWQVRPEEDGTIFSALREPQYPRKCIKPDANAIHANHKGTTEARRLGEVRISENDARAECVKWTKHDLANCVKDVLKTQDYNIAAIYE